MLHKVLYILLKLDIEGIYFTLVHNQIYALNLYNLERK